MSDYDFPELPSDEELGISDADREQYEKDFADDNEPVDEELAALLGDPPPGSADAAKKTRGSAKSDDSEGDKPKADRKAARAARKAEKQRAKEEKRRAKEVERQAQAAKKAAKSGEPSPAAGDARGALAADDASGVGQDEARAEEDGDGDGGKKAKKPAAAGPAVADGPRSRWRGPASLVALLAVCFVASSRTGMPRPVPANAADTVFSSARAMSTLVDVARRAHPPGSPEHARVRALLVDRLRSLGFEPEVQTTTSLIERGGLVRSATVRNIVARLPGTAPTGTVLITAHYDSREIAVGASDDGSGVVTIIEAVRALQTGEPLTNDLIVLFTDGEELGLLGARAFVDQHRWMADVDLVLSFEMRGGGGPSIMFETNDDNGWVTRAYGEFAAHPFANSMAYDVYQRIPNDTDFTPFREAGVQGLNFAAIDNAHVYHQVYDTPENLDESTLQHHGLHALAALKHFGHEDLSAVDAPNVVYFSLPVLGLIIYPQSLALPISAVLVLMLGLLAVLGRRAGVRPVRTVLGFVLSLTIGGLVYGMATGLLGWLSDVHVEDSSLHGSLYHSEGWYVLALAFATLALVTGLTSLTRRWIAPLEFAIGALVIPVVLAVGVSAVAPLAAMNLQWPVFAGLASAIVLALLGERSENTVGWVVSLLLALPVILFIEPLVELLWLAMSIRLAAALGVLMVLGFFMFVPALQSLRHPNSWWAPVMGTVLAGACLGLGLFTARPSADRPLPTTLVYAYEHGSGAAVWATSAVEEDADQPSEGRLWAAERAGGDFPETRDLTDFGYRAGVVPVTRADVANAAPPEVVLLADSTVQSERHVTLGVRSRIGAEMLGFQFSEGTRLLSLNGVSLTDAETIRQADHWGDPDGSVVLEVLLPANDPIGVHVIEHLLRPETLLGEGAFARAPDLAPDVNRMSDRAMFRYSVAAFVDPQHAIVPREELGVNPVAPADTSGVEPVATDTLITDTVSVEPLTADSVLTDTSSTGSSAPDTVLADTMRVTPSGALVTDTPSSAPTDPVPADTLHATPPGTPPIEAADPLRVGPPR